MKVRISDAKKDKRTGRISFTISTIYDNKTTTVPIELVPDKDGVTYATTTPLVGLSHSSFKED